MVGSVKYTSFTPILYFLGAKIFLAFSPVKCPLLALGQTQTDPLVWTDPWSALYWIPDHMTTRKSKCESEKKEWKVKVNRPLISLILDTRSHDDQKIKKIADRLYSISVQFGSSLVGCYSSAAVWGSKTGYCSISRLPTYLKPPLSCPPVKCNF